MKQISKNAYKGFNKRVIDAFMSIDPYYLDGIGKVMDMIDLYLNEMDVKFETRTKEVKLVYMILLPELEKAVERSMRARRNAAIRREKKLAKLEAEKNAAAGAGENQQAQTIAEHNASESMDSNEVYVENVLAGDEKIESTSTSVRSENHDTKEDVDKAKKYIPGMPITFVGGKLT